MSQQSSVTWRDLKRFSALESHGEEAAGLETLLRATKSDWEALFTEEEMSWARAATAIAVMRLLADMSEDLPHLIGPTVADIWAAGLWPLLKEQLGSLCNLREVDIKEVQKAVDGLKQFLPGKRKQEIQSTLSEIGRKFGLEIDGFSTKESGEEMNIGATDLRFPPIQILQEPPKGKLKSSTEESESVQTLLESQCDLLSEDFLFPLRRGLSDLTKAADDLYCYGRISLGQASIVGSKICFEAMLDSKEFHFADLDWDSSQRLLPGSLLILTNTNSPVLIQALVERREAQDASRGRFLLRLQDAKDFKLVKQAPSFLLYESKVYFEAYQHVIRGLRRKTRLPFASLLTAGEKKKETIQSPEYFREKILDAQTKVNTQCLQSLTPRKTSPPLMDAESLFRKLIAPSEKDTTQPNNDVPLKDLLDDTAKANTFLNDSQLRAFRSSLKQEVSLIQGPPGTGKTFIGKVLLSFLMDNQSLWRKGNNNGPIVIICYTNHALDSLLEGLLPVSRKLVRVGGRSKLEALEAHTLTALRKSLREKMLRNGDVHKLEKSLKWRKAQLIESLEKRFSRGESNEEELKELKNLQKRIEDLQLLESARLLRKADFVGFTTTGAAKNHALLERLKPKILLIEEAGQILEGHCLASLPSSCQHLIMIGDHQQLRPTTATYHLARNYGLDVSLFERLILNNVSFTRLQEQHRMRPEIAAVMSQVYYPGLRNHSSVEAFPKMAGTEKNLFFLDHDMAESSVNDTRSKVNIGEAEFILELAKYFLHIRYKAEDITILTTYVGQWLVIRRMVASLPQAHELRKVRISVVDNFQGEENKIILLSLVRSGSGSIGFLSHANRSCVALSRAQWGFFIVGNMTDLAVKSETWRRVEEELKDQDCIGRSLRLSCPHHPETVSEVNIASSGTLDYNKCKLPCDAKLSCGHVCPQPCHLSDRKHVEEFKCLEDCSKKCSEGHLCNKTCTEQCYPCEHTDLETFEKCGHQVEVACLSLRQPKVCTKLESKAMNCGHVKSGLCHAWNEEECNENCDHLLSCGHSCGLVCHFDAKQGDEKKNKHDTKCLQSCKRKCSGGLHSCTKSCWQQCEDKCSVQVVKALTCEHKEATMQCHMAAEEFDCPEKCMKSLACGHTCKSYCHECSKETNGCVPCAVRVKSTTLFCGHEGRNFKCSEVDNFVCKHKCEKKLLCGHACCKGCNEECGSCEESSCKATDVTKEAISPATQYCGKDLRCGHSCLSSAANCLEGRIHPPCKEQCSRFLVCGHPCPDLCGQPCAPCKKQKCLLSPCEHSPCKAICEDPCTTACKVKCGRVCAHTKCGKKCSSEEGHVFCSLPCEEKLECGHQCKGFCGEVCPQEACLVCNGADEKEKYYSLPCGHALKVSSFEALLSRSTSSISLPRCPQCNVAVSHAHRFKRELSLYKKQAIRVADKFFAIKSGVPKMKLQLEKRIKDGEGNEALRKQAELVISNKKSPASYNALIDLETKFALVKHLQSFEGNFDIGQSIIKTSSLDKDSVLQILAFFEAQGHPVSEELRGEIRLLSFDDKDWKLCSNCAKEHVFYAAFLDKCLKTG